MIEECSMCTHANTNSTQCNVYANHILFINSFAVEHEGQCHLLAIMYNNVQDIEQ